MKSSHPEKRVCRIAIVASSPLTFQAFLLPHIEVLSRGFDVAMVTNLKSGLQNDELVPANILAVHVPIERRMAVFRDIFALLALVKAFGDLRPDVVLTVGPKAGLLGILSSRIVGTRHRLHWFTGQVWANKTGLYRRMLVGADKVIGRLATNVLVDSQSQLNFLVNSDVLRKNQGSVLCNGSVSGVDSRRFFPSESRRTVVRRMLKIGGSEIVTLFLGRLNREKGILDLMEAYANLSPAGGHLLLVGPDEGNLSEWLHSFASERGVVLSLVGQTDSPELYMAAADIFCLPSYREGFGSAVIEAAAAGLPAVVSDVYGLQDSIENGVTGVSFPVGDLLSLKKSLDLLHRDAELRSFLGRNARRRALQNFSQSALTSALSQLLRAAVVGDLKSRR